MFNTYTIVAFILGAIAMYLFVTQLDYGKVFAIEHMSASEKFGVGINYV